MTIAAYKGQGTAASGTTGAITPTNGTHAAGDYLLLLLAGNVTDFTTTNALTGGRWATNAVKLGSALSTDSNLLLEAWVLIAASVSETNPTITPTGANNTHGVVLVFESQHATIPTNEISIAISGAATAGLIYMPGFTSRVDDLLVINVAAWALDGTGPIFTGETNSSLGSLTERYDAGTAGGNGSGIGVWTGTKASAGQVLPTQVAAGGTSNFVVMTLALNPIADKTIAGTVTIDGAAAANGNDVRALDVTQPAASYLCSVAVTTGGTGAFSISAPYTSHSYQAVYEDGSSYGASAVAAAV